MTTRPTPRLWRGETATKYVLSCYGSKAEVSTALYAEARRTFGAGWAAEYCPTLGDFVDDYIRFELVSPAGVVQCDSNYEWQLENR